MSKRIDKKLREAAQKDHQKILDENKSFFDEVLMPMVEEKIIKANEEKKKVRRLTFKRFGYIAASLAFVVCVLSMLWVFYPKDKPDDAYTGPFETELSDLTTANQNLTKTQLYGEFDSIVRSFDLKTGKTMYFTIYQTVASDESVIQTNIRPVIERSLICNFGNADYTKRLSFLGCEVQYNESLSHDTYEEISVLEVSIEAYFDTGKERYFLTYYEITTNESFSFEDYLASIISAKKYYLE